MGRGTTHAAWRWADGGASKPRADCLARHGYSSDPLDVHDKWFVES